jgi:sterol desaturase/sphingolipid hydroxylase (fatty acid hydroxylase superfamily)
MMHTTRQYIDWYLSHTGAKFILIAYTSFLAFELIFGRKERATRKDVAFNYVYLISVLTVYIFLRPFCSSLANDAAKLLGGPYLDLSFHANGRPWWNLSAGLLFIFIFDFFYYWHHRLQHKSSLFWSTHKLHHSDENMGITTAYKHHWTDDAARTVTILFPLGLLFKLEPVTLFWVNYLFASQGLFSHMNLNWRFGVLNRFVTTPDLHRMHHSKLPEHRDKNFASFFPLFDLLFGTYLAPCEVTPPTGLDTGEKMTSLVRAHVYPFADWWSMAKGRLSAKKQPAGQRLKF